MRTTWHSAIGDWLNWLKVGNRPDTIRLRQYQVVRFAQDNPAPWAATTEHMINWLTEHASWSDESRRSYRSALRSFYGWAHAAGRIDHNPAALIPAVKRRQHAARPVPEAVFTEAIALADDRVQLMLLLGARQGMRRGEIARLHTNDLIEDLAGWSLLIHGKGGKQRIIPANDDVVRRIRAAAPGFLFPGQDHGHLSPPYVGKLMAHGLDEGWTAHTLRHRFATVVYAGSRDLVAVQELLGHASTETTRIYVRLPDDAMRTALAHAA